MSQIPRPILDTTRPCLQCGTALKITFDALNRPRHRCPQCHGVVTTPIDAGLVARIPAPAPGLELVAPSRQQLQRLAQTVRPRLAPPGPRRCADCGHPLPAQALGRPRQRCADRRACRERAA